MLQKEKQLIFHHLVFDQNYTRKIFFIINGNTVIMDESLHILLQYKKCIVMAQNYWNTFNEKNS